MFIDVSLHFFPWFHVQFHPNIHPVVGAHGNGVTARANDQQPAWIKIRASKMEWFYKSVDLEIDASPSKLEIVFCAVQISYCMILKLYRHACFGSQKHSFLSIPFLIAPIKLAKLQFVGEFPRLCCSKWDVAFVTMSCFHFSRLNPHTFAFEHPMFWNVSNSRSHWNSFFLANSSYYFIFGLCSMFWHWTKSWAKSTSQVKSPWSADRQYQGTAHRCGGWGM